MNLMRRSMWVSLLWILGYAWAQTLNVSVERVSLEPGDCSDSFTAYALAHTTNVPGGDEVRMFEANGGGVALGDLDNDGDLDIVLANHEGPNSLLWNEGDLQFRREAFAQGEARAVTLVDLDADGLLDIVVSRRVSAPNYWRNVGDGTFENQLLPGVTKPLYAINWADLDLDGDLDLVGATYDAALLTELGQEFLQSAQAGVYVYTNESGSFSETRLAQGAQALALELTDLNGDARPDIIVGNDFAVPDMTFLNVPEGWAATEPFTHTSHSTMSLAADDLDNDGRAELFATDMKPYPGEDETPWGPLMEAMMGDPHPEGDPQIMENVLQRAGDDGFVNEAAAWGVTGTGWSWSGKFGDLDSDGLLDLYVVNGMMELSTFSHLPNHELVEQNQAFRNGGSAFVPVPEWGLNSELSGRGMSMGDLDNDGDLDIVVNNLRGPAQLFENRLCGGTGLEVELRGSGGNTRAVGARLILQTTQGKLYRTVRAASGYLSGDPARVHFGVAQGAGLETLTIVWPDGQTSEVTDLNPSQRLTVTAQP